ncbi:MAG: DUF3795 domain-containing protein [Bacteroidales bacterium]|nr:DUF3795 domain-containing protein [Bacteroidales bacterium]
MNKKQSRREFVRNGSKIGLACGAFACCPGMKVFGNFFQDEVPDPKKLNYCGYSCPPDCPMYVATLENDTAKKEQAFKDWKIEEKYGIEFNADEVFCHTCKNKDKPQGVVVSNCLVRECAIGRGYDCCIECNDLAGCGFDLWNTYPDFHKLVIEMQKKYKAAIEKA